MRAAGDSTLHVRTAAEWPLCLSARCVRQTRCSHFDPVALLPVCARPWRELCVKPKPEQELSKQSQSASKKSLKLVNSANCIPWSIDFCKEMRGLPTTSQIGHYIAALRTMIVHQRLLPGDLVPSDIPVCKYRVITCNAGGSILNFNNALKMTFYKIRF